ncbi:MAG: A/G-specific adenine glycosylase [Planctomycetes bacterium]|nr:A/G-specific adenine glycosylase [Planctomycetota bacterium]
MNSFADRLLAWYEQHRRDLPWRRDRDPWAIWVSEVMLQQTRVEAVREPFERFLRRFPTPAAFAVASDDELLLAWKGLGYYRRARLLRDGARAVVERHAGAVPGDPAALLSLPGVGTYTKGAIASIAFGHAEPAVDGNVERVFARHRGITADVKTAASQRLLRALVVEHLPPARAGDFNQALMELGATVCTPQSPRCERCPVRSGCAAAKAGNAAQLPVRKPPRQAVTVTARVALALRAGAALGNRVPAEEPNAGQIELPGAGILRDLDPADLATVLRQRFAARVTIGAELARARHAITHHRITVHAHAATVAHEGALQWFDLAPTTPWTTPSRKLLAAVAATDA